jgi:Bifunctional DNA primase/polymerase, N-terminal
MRIFDSPVFADALNDALRLARYGRPSFPCLASKRPASPNGFKDASADPEQLRRLWQAYPGPLVGVPTGEASALFVVDVDSGRHNKANDWLESVFPYLPPTRWHATKSGGWHLLFKHRAGLRNTAGKLSRGVDTRGDGGYIIWWPFHLGLAAPHKRQRLADVPDWLCERLIERPRSTFNVPRTASITAAPARLRGILETAAKASEGERNHKLFWCANRLRDMAACGELDQGDFNQACNDLIRTAISIGLTQREAERTIASALRAAP